MAGNPLVWLLDIDGTLLRTERAGRDAYVLAVRDLLGREDHLDGVAFAGRTDRLITDDVLRRHGVEPDDDVRAAFWDRVLEHMRRLMEPPRGALLPGVEQLLDALDAEPGWVTALLTGNETLMAGIKLGAFGIAGRFDFGAFGEEGADRDAVARLAVSRAAKRHGVGPSRCVVVGDTEHDVACARAAGAWAVAVATGGATRDVLAASGPDLLLADLTDAAALVEWGRGL